MRTISVVTVSRSDYGIYRPLLRAIDSDNDLNLKLLVGGMHLSPDFGLTKNEIEADGYPISAYIDMLLASNSPEGISKSIGLGIIGFSQTFSRIRPDILVVLGDRFEMFTAAIAALPFRIPVAHIHGGELTQGAFDDSIRHSITKLSHVHFASTQEYAKRIIQLGEEPWRVHNVGALSIDNLSFVVTLSKDEFQKRFDLSDVFLLVTFHPVTLEYEQVQYQISNLLEALETWGGDVLFTFPNADPGGKEIRDRINKYINVNPNWVVVENLGTAGYYTAMRWASAMVGNSSSGIVEAGLFNLPVVNIGTRQDGRVRTPNIIDVGYEESEILGGIKKALFKKSSDQSNSSSIYGDGTASQKMREILSNLPITQELIQKNFHDVNIINI